MAKKKLTLEEAVVMDVPYEVPENWMWVKLKSIAVINMGQSPKSQDVNDICQGYPLIGGPSDMGETNPLKNRYTFKANKISSIGTIIMSIRATLGKINISDGEYCLGRGVAEINPLNISREFMIYYLTYIKEELYKCANGTTFLQISKPDIENLKVVFPPLKEQLRIVDRIESLFEKLDKAKELIEESREGFEKRKTAILEKAFRGELTEKWRRENNSLAKVENLIELIKEERYSMIKTNREKKEMDLTFDGHNYDYEYVPNQWIKVKSSMICDTISSGKTPKAGVGDSGDIPFLKVYNIVDNNISFSYRPQFISREIHEGAMKSSNLIEKDIVMNIVGPPLRKVAIITDEYTEWNMNQNMVRFRPIKFIDYKYLYYCLLREETLNKAIDESKGVVGQIIISTVKCRNLEIPLPSLIEQKEIIRILDNTYKKDITIDELTNLEEKIESIRKSILAKAFRGELGTNCEEDESALELLKEILSKE